MKYAIYENPLTHKFALLDDDLRGIEYVYRNFYQFGPSINYNSSSGGGGFGGGMARVNYADLMTATDQDGISRSYLANEENFNFLKQLETKNLLVPVIGNFSGPKAIRAVGINSAIVSSDLGQAANPLHPDGLSAFFAGLKKQGFTEEEIGRMSKVNPAKLLGLESAK